MRFVRRFRNLIAALALLALTPALVSSPAIGQVITGAGSGGASRYPIDANDLVVWTLADATGVTPFYVNTGTTSGCNLDTKTGASFAFGSPGSGANAVQGVRGIVTDGSLYIDNAGNNGITYSLDSSTCTTAVEPTSITIETWIRPMIAFTNSNLNIFNKAYRPDGTFTSPFISFNLGINLSGAGGLVPFYNVTIAGVQHTATCQATTTFSSLIAGQWNHVAVTFDGTSFIVTCYVNGAAAGAQTLAGAIDYGTHGRWSILAPADSLQSLSASYWNDARISNIARPASYFQAEWRAGLGLVP